ncbi:hypothetical protein ACHAXT_012590 [Thalassiosira profunda]
MAIRGSELCFGLVMLLEAAQLYNTPTPPRATKKRGAASLTAPSLPPSGPVKPIHCCKPVGSYHHLPPKKRVKLDFAEASGVGAGPRSPCKPINFRPIQKAGKCTKGSAHRVWEQTGSSPSAAASASRFSSLVAVDAMAAPQKNTTATKSKASNGSFVLYEKDDDDHINALHNVVRRDIWEGFVVNASSEGAANSDISCRRSGRLARYEGTVGFRCRFCKHVPYLERAEKSAVYPRSLERIYLANIRFQRDHVEHCTFIPAELKDEYWRLKESKNLGRGRKQYWVTSAQRRGLCNGANGIVFQAGSN